MKSSSSWSTARRSRPSAGSASRASARGSFAPDTSTRRSSSIGRSPGRSSSRLQLPLPGSTPPASAGRRPARSTDDLPLPDGPTMPRKPAPTRRATSSAMSRSRPKKYSASTGSKLARPLNGHGLLDRRAGRSGRAGEDTHPFADELKVDHPSCQLRLDLFQVALPAAAREATSTSGRLASRTTISSAARASSRQVG